jgi:putative aldouronate transport system permease protein
MFYNLTRNSGILYSTTDVMDTYVYRTLRVTGDTGMASAAGLFQSIVGFVLVLVSNTVVKKIDREYSLF